MLSVKCAVDDHFLLRLGILCKYLNTIVVSIEVPELAVNKLLLFLLSCLSCSLWLKT